MNSHIFTFRQFLEFSHTNLIVTAENALQVTLPEFGHATGAQTSVRLTPVAKYKEPKTTAYAGNGKK